MKIVLMQYVLTALSRKDITAQNVTSVIKVMKMHYVATVLGVQSVVKSVKIVDGVLNVWNIVQNVAVVITKMKNANMMANTVRSAVYFVIRAMNV